MALRYEKCFGIGVIPHYLLREQIVHYFMERVIGELAENG